MQLPTAANIHLRYFAHTIPIEEHNFQQHSMKDSTSTPSNITAQPSIGN
ncbi:MAG: hypothetical protein Q4F57_08470 [Weeksellaceae bacterium]|nr:hypothetical protein [Weeksellaceae bacterium]